MKLILIKTSWGKNSELEGFFSTKESGIKSKIPGKKAKLIYFGEHHATVRWKVRNHADRMKHSVYYATISFKSSCNSIISWSNYSYTSGMLKFCSFSYTSLRR